MKLYPRTCNASISLLLLYLFCRSMLSIPLLLLSDLFFLVIRPVISRTAPLPKWPPTQSDTVQIILRVIFNYLFMYLFITDTDYRYLYSANYLHSTLDVVSWLGFEPTTRVLPGDSPKTMKVLPAGLSNCQILHQLHYDLLDFGPRLPCRILPCPHLSSVSKQNVIM